MAARSGTPAVFVLAAVGVLAAAGVNVALARQDRAERAPRRRAAAARGT